MSAILFQNAPVRIAFIVLLTLSTGCGKDVEETAALSYLNEHYEGTFRIVDKTQRGSKNWFIAEDSGQPFKIAASTVPPHHVVEDGFPDLQYGRMLEEKIDPKLNPVVDARLSKADREKIRDTGKLEKAVPEKLALYLAVIGEPSSEQENHAVSTVRDLSKDLPFEFRWEMSVYDSSADAALLKYRPVVPKMWMQQSAEHYPQSEKIKRRYSGVADQGNVTVKMGSHD